jgi:hypothetical protein
LFSYYQATRKGSVLTGNGASASVHGVGTVDLKFTSGRIMQLKNVYHVPAIKKNLVSGFLLCREGFKLVFESNKVVVTKYGLFVGKGYECGGLFRFSLADFCNKVMNNIHSNVNETEVWHSRLCHIGFGSMTRLAKLNLIPSSTRFCYVYLLNTKSEALHYFKIYKAEVENQLERNIKRIRSDRGGEYFSNEFDSFCAEHGIIHERTPPYSP